MVQRTLKRRLPKSAQVPTEMQEADTFMAYLRSRGIRYTHVKNETGALIAQGKIKNSRAFWGARDGVSKGFPDFVIAVPKVGMAFVELKRIRGGRTSDEQLEWVDTINLCPGSEARVCKGADEAIRFIEKLAPSGYNFNSVF